jgi:hypothetical protein
MSVKQPAFRPVQAGTVNIAVNAGSQRVAVQSERSSSHVRIVNNSGVTIFVEFGDVTIVATVATGLPIPAGAVEVLRLDTTHIAAIAAVAGPSTIYFTPGEGL